MHICRMVSWNNSYISHFLVETWLWLVLWIQCWAGRLASIPDIHTWVAREAWMVWNCAMHWTSLEIQGIWLMNFGYLHLNPVHIINTCPIWDPMNLSHAESWPNPSTILAKDWLYKRLQVSPNLSVDCATFYVFRKEKQKHTKWGGQ